MTHPSRLIDKHGRKLKKLRVSLLDTCNMRCFYCMPEKPQFLSSDKLLSTKQIFDICSNLMSFGIDEVRLTGGEPLLRPDFLTIVEKLSTLPLSKLALTTNGIKLQTLLPSLINTNLKYINVSVDSLNRQNFTQITKYDGLNQILEAISLAKGLGFHIKINTVLLRGVNDHEVEDFIKFSKKFNVTVRFLEAMKIGEMLKDYDRLYIPVGEVLKQIQLNHTLVKADDACDSTSFNYNLENGAKIGFIASESKSFCGQCSRLRLSATGTIYPCLFIDEGLNLKNVPLADYHAILEHLIDKKPFERVSLIEKPMHAIGG